MADRNGHIRGGQRLQKGGTTMIPQALAYQEVPKPAGS
jgi:hypothetical protein